MSLMIRCLVTGQGTYTYPDGRQYVGEWKNGIRHGQGTYTFLDGGQYVGEWENDKPNWQGTLTFPFVNYLYHR